MCDAEARHLGLVVEREVPTEQELNTLCRVPDRLPALTYLVALVELCERFSFYTCKNLFQNYLLSNHGPNTSRSTATALNLLFTFLSYLTPILGAVVADQYLGRYKTILLFANIYTLGLCILWTTSLPGILHHDQKLAAFIVAIVIIALGTGGIKSNVAPLIADQYTNQALFVAKNETDGSRVIIDPQLTYNRIYNIYFGSTELGSLLAMVGPFMEKYIGFWAPFLLAFVVFCVTLAILVSLRNVYRAVPARNSAVTKSFCILWRMILYRSTNLQAIQRGSHDSDASSRYDEELVHDVKRTLAACKVFVFLPIVWLCFTQLSSNLVTQASQMQLHGAPNDLMQCLEQITVMVFLPVVDRILMPFLSKQGIILSPIRRIVIGFVFVGMGVSYAAIVQQLVYSAPPCYRYPLACTAAIVDGHVQPNRIHVAMQVPIYIFFGIGSILLNVACVEYAYVQSPASLKSFVQALFLLTVAAGSALSMALVPVSKDPLLVWLFTGVAAATFLLAFIMHQLL